MDYQEDENAWITWLRKIDVNISHKVSTINNSWIVDICLWIPSHLFRTYSYPILLFVFVYTFPRLEFFMEGNDQLSLLPDYVAALSEKNQRKYDMAYLVLIYLL